MQAEVDITDTIVVHTGGEVGSQDAGRRTLKTTPAKAGERDVEMSEASVLAEAPGAITKETERTTTAEGVARTRGRPKKTPAAPQVAIRFTAGGPGENTRKRRSTEVLSEDQARPDVQEQIAQLKELILTLIQGQQEYQQKQEEKQKASYEAHERKLDDFIQKQTDRTNELIQQQKKLQEENKKLQEENKKLRTTNAGNGVRRPTFADIARRGSEGSSQTGTDTTARTSSNEGQTRIRMQDDPRTITINTFRVEGEKEDFNVVRERLQRSLDSFQVTERVQIECLRPLPGDRINVVFRTEAEARTAREHKQWVTTAMPTARIKGETWYPVKCDMVSKEAVGDVGEDNKLTLKPEVCTRFKDDNSEEGLDFTAHQARWLSKPNPNKRTGSLVIWLKNKMSAEYLLRKGQVLFGAYGAFCSQYHSAPDDGPCYNCNSYGHKQSHCKKPAKCGICSEKHQTRDCTNRDKPKCPACTGPHPIFDRRCIRHPRHIEKGAGREEPVRPRANPEPHPGPKAGPSRPRTNPEPEPYPWSTVRSTRTGANRVDLGRPGTDIVNKDQTRAHPPLVIVRSPIHRSRSLESIDIDMGSLNSTQC
jgi:hypothetical protein